MLIYRGMAGLSAEALVIRCEPGKVNAIEDPGQAYIAGVLESFYTTLGDNTPEIFGLQIAVVIIL